MKRLAALGCLAALLLVPAPGWAAIAVDGTSSATSGGSSVTSITVSHTVTSNTNGLMLIGIGVEVPATFSTLTVNGSSTGVTSFSTSLWVNQRAELYYLKMPPTGTYNVVYSISSAAKRMTIGVVSLTGVNQTSPLSGGTTHSEATNAPSVTVTSATDSLVFDVLASTNGTTAIGGGQTQRVADGNNLPYLRMSSEPGAASVVMSWTLSSNNDYGHIGVSVDPATSGGQAPRSMHQHRMRRD